MSKTIERLVVAGTAGVFVVGTWTGVNLAFSSPDNVAAESICETKKVAKGDVLSSNLVMVHVYNASRRAGIANRVKINLERRGFLGGVAKNNPGGLRSRNVTIMTRDPKDPRVKLVSRQFKGKVDTVTPDFELEDGVSVLIGPDYKGLRKAKTKLRATEDVTVCVPSITLP